MHILTSFLICNIMIISLTFYNYLASQMELVAKNPPANAGDVRNADRSLGQKDTLDESMASICYYSIPAWRISWTEELGTR